MKFALLSLLALLFTCQAFAAIHPEEKKAALGKTGEVMMKIAGVKSEPKLIASHVTDEFGSRLLVEFSFTEDLEVSKKCSYSYDRVLKRVLPDSWTCDI
jgi:hypothetical protein